MTQPDSPPAAGEPLLVIDNDEDILDLLSFVFRRRGFTVHTAREGTAGVALARAHHPAVVICDILMAGMHGFEVLRRRLRRQAVLARRAGVPRRTPARRPGRAAAGSRLLGH